MESNYGWIITQDHITFDIDNEEGVTGPNNISDEMTTRLINGEGTKFRLYDDDDELYYEGRYIGDMDDGDPLTDFGGPNAGCTYMKEYIDGRWVDTIG